MKKIIVLIVLSAISYHINAQDVIFMNSDEQRSVIVKKVGLTTIEYVRYDNQSGAIYEVLKTDVSKIKYQNGVEDIFMQDKNQGDTKFLELTVGEFVDTRDGRTYKYVNIGNQTWMAENLKFEIGKSLYSTNDADDDCGRYYSFDEAILACPNNWHLPTDKDWMELEMWAGMLEPYTAMIGWRGNIPGQATSLLKNGITGLDLFLCGFIFQQSKSKKRPFYVPVSFGDEAFYWTSTESSKKKAYYRQFKNIESIRRAVWSKEDRFPIRCVKD